jgi:hypothetical protein
MTQHHELFAALAAPFEPNEIKVRSHTGRQLHYITARTVMNRLDSVLGPENWWDEYVPNENSVLCRLTVRLPDGSILTKSDAGGYAGMADSGDDDKSGYSDAFKRAAVKFGIARYLYRDGVPSFVQESLQAQAQGQAQAETPPKTERSANGSTAAQTTSSSRNSGDVANPPRTGRSLFAWTKEQEQQHQVGLLKYLNQWAKLQDFPGRMVDWNADQVTLGYHEAIRKIQAIESSSRESYEEALAN